MQNQSYSEGPVRIPRPLNWLFRGPPLLQPSLRSGGTVGRGLHFPHESRACWDTSVLPFEKESKNLTGWWRIPHCPQGWVSRVAGDPQNKPTTEGDEKMGSPDSQSLCSGPSGHWWKSENYTLRSLDPKSWVLCALECQHRRRKVEGGGGCVFPPKAHQLERTVGVGGVRARILRKGLIQGCCFFALRALKY